MDRVPATLALLFASLSASAAQVVAMPQWRSHFDAAGVHGTFVLLDPAKDTTFVFDEARAKRGYLPASTFKVPNALIGLEVGSIADENEVFKWDGKPKMRPEWERDQTLAGGMRDSTVWMFQEVARRTGKQRMKEWLNRLDYGNRDLGGGIDLFWLQGNLRISAMQQVEFMHKLAEGRLPMSQRSQRLVREAMTLEKTRDYKLFAKTGTTGGKAPLNWWVGCVERRGKLAGCFAMNLDAKATTKFADRFTIGRGILREAGVLPAETLN